jgi:hypothetical protein
MKKLKYFCLQKQKIKIYYSKIMENINIPNNLVDFGVLILKTHE